MSSQCDVMFYLFHTESTSNFLVKQNTAGFMLVIKGINAKPDVPYTGIFIELLYKLHLCINVI